MIPRAQQNGTLLAACSIMGGAVAIAEDRFTIPASTSVDLELIDATLGGGDVRVVVFGDSFAVSAWGRVFPQILNHWPYGPLTAVAGGSVANSGVVWGDTAATPFAGIQSAQAEPSYEVLRSSVARMFYALPVRMREAYFDSTFVVSDGSPLLSLRAMTGGSAPDWMVAGDRFGFRFLYWFSPQVNVPQVVIGGQEQMLGGPLMHVSATPEQLFTFNGGGELSVGVFADPTTLNTNAYFHPAGGVFYKVDETGERQPGLYYTALADSSWSYRGFGIDLASASGEKRYSAAQLEHWLNATTLEMSQPLVVFYYLATEPAFDLEMGSQVELEEMIDTTNLAIDRSIIEAPVVHCLVLPHFHGISHGGSSLPLIDDTVRLWFESQREAMFRIARDRSDVAAISLYDVTEGRFMPSLLDHFRVHPSGAGAQFFASCLGHLFGADLLGDADQNGRIDFKDVTEILANWLEPGPLGDANRDGWVDFADLTSVLANWNRPCRP